MDIYQTAELKEFGQGNYPVTMSTTQGRISPETVPSYASLQKTANVPDKNCLICLKTGMTLEKLTFHLFAYHDICYLEDEFDLDKWYEAEECWNGEPTPATSDSENEVGTVEEVIEDSYAPKLPILLPRPKESGNSSDSSSYNSSSSQKKKVKKSQAKRITDRYEAKIHELEEKNKAQFTEFKDYMVTRFEDLDSKAIERDNKGNILLERSVTNVAGVVNGNLSLLRADIESNRVKIESAAKVSEERHVELRNSFASVKTDETPSQSISIVQPPMESNNATKQNNGIIENLSSV